MKQVTFSVNKSQEDYLGLLIHEDAAKTLSSAAKECIVNEMALENKFGHGMNGLYVSEFDDFWTSKLLNREDTTLTIYHVKFYDRYSILPVRATNFTTAGILAMAYAIHSGEGFGIEWIESERTKNKVPFEL